MTHDILHACILQGRARFELYQRLVALIFAAAQSWGALLFVRPYVADFGGSWLFESMLTLIVGSVIMNHVRPLPPITALLDISIP